MQYSKYWSMGIKNGLWEPRSSRTNSTEVVRYGFAHVLTLKLNREYQEKITCTEGRAK